MLDMNVTFRDLGLISVFIVIVIAGLFLIRALAHLGGAMRILKKLIGDNAESLDKVVKDLPALSSNAAALTEHASEVAENLRNEQELIDSALESVCDTIESVSDTARTINEDLIGSIKRLVKTLLSLAGFVSKKKQPGAPGAPEADAAPEDSGAPQAEPAKREKRERRPKRERVRVAAVAARKRQADKARNINIHIR